MLKENLLSLLWRLFIHFTVLVNSSNYLNYLNESEIKKKGEEIKKIGESINLFYLPPYDLLTTYDENTTIRAKKRKIA